MVINLSLAIFLIYFCVLREPNDIDEQLGLGLFDVMPELELPMFESELKRLEAHGMDTSDIKRKLEELKNIRKGST